MRVSAYCAECLARVALLTPRGADAPGADEGTASCPNGHEAIPFRHSEAVRAGTAVDRCSRCGSTSFFSQKDFDQRLGCLLLLVGVALALLVGHFFGGVFFAPALVAFAGLDFLVARRVGSVVICYRCDTEYRDVPGAASYKSYDPHVAERDAPLKTLRRMNP